MKKIAIRLHNNTDAHLIFHATPVQKKINPYDLYEHQWYLTEDKSEIGIPIDGENYEMYSTTTELIKEKNFDGLYLYCKRTDKNTNEESNTEFIRLFSNIIDVLNSGTVFDDVSYFGEDGFIISNCQGGIKNDSTVQFN
ncbi:hypothetical protein [Bacillus subtilis]|uniref:hypothetical protein n=1 Tax=Bacillus subtilis TaxID=1423 RepID=UPI001B9896F7|nr:hypothetical protein [Bacillus subtilis]CAI6330988.1 Putative glycosyltransferase [Bacillus subtilis]